MQATAKHTTAKRRRSPKPDFEELYAAVRRHENKVYTDAKLRLLPDIGIHLREWEARAQSSKRLLNYLAAKHRPLNILEAGCGNGWLSARLAGLPQSRVTGIDVNLAEITQAARVFKQDNLEFIYDTFNENTFDTERFDVVVFAATLQYFPSVVNVLRLALSLLNTGGEVHIIDTPFYTPTEAGAAAQRCRDYYKAMGLPQMADHYYHYAISEFWGFDYKIMYNPHSLYNRVFKKAPFYWIMIKQ